MIFSIYSILLFGNLCKPKENDTKTTSERFRWDHSIKCHGHEEDYTTVKATWVLLILMTGYWFMREILNCAFLRLTFFLRYSSYRRLITDALIREWFITKKVTLTIFFAITNTNDNIWKPKSLLSKLNLSFIFCLYKGFPHPHMQLERWQYHLASIAGFLLWLQMMIELGRYPGWGKYIMMLK